jgi:hypothetical protein
MPDTKFSWRGLREHLRKYLWFYLLGIVLGLVGAELLWTMTRPRIPANASVNIYMAAPFSDAEPLQALAPDILARVQADDPSVRQVYFESLMYNEQVYTSNMLLLTRLSVGECDAFLASQEAMDALVASETLVPLDDALAAGWMGAYGLEPYVVTTEDEDTGKTATWTAGLRLDSVEALAKMQAFDNEGAFLCVTSNGGNTQAAMKALEYLMSDRMEAAHAGTEAA